METKQSCNDEEKIKIGKIIFKQTFTQNQRKQLINVDKQNILNQQGWWLGGVYQDDKWAQIFLQAQSSSFQSLNLSFARLETVLTDIYQIKFPNLKQLYLSRNNIKSIECFSFIIAPNIKILYLSYNHITRLQSFRKNTFLNLQIVNIYGNYIQELSSLGRIKFKNKPFLQIYSLNQMPFQNNIMGISQFMKLQKVIQRQTCETIRAMAKHQHFIKRYINKMVEIIAKLQSQ